MAQKDLIQLIGSAGNVPAVAEKLGENPRTVLAWFRKQRAPSLRAAVNIIAVYGGAIDYNGIYTPFGAKVVRDARRAS